jgi:hypothetical protein
MTVFRLRLVVTVTNITLLLNNYQLAYCLSSLNLGTDRGIGGPYTTYMTSVTTTRLHDTTKLILPF